MTNEGDVGVCCDAYRSAKDNESRIICISKLQSALENGAQSLAVQELDAVIGIIKDGLHANAHVQAAALHFFAAYSYALNHRTADVTPDDLDNHLRHAVETVSPNGGLLERLGDGKETSRETARNALERLAIDCLRLQSTNEDTPYSRLDKHIKEQGFASKNARTRVQCVSYLVKIKALWPTLPLRSYMPCLLNALEDGDPIVRETAKTGLADLFCGPGVSTAAKSDLRNQLAARESLRKPTVDYVMSRVFNDNAISSTTPSRNVSRAQSEEDLTITDGMTNLQLATPAANSAASPKPVYVGSSKDVEDEFKRMHAAFDGKETEHNWQTREKHVQRIRGMIKGNAASEFQQDLMSGVRLLSEGIIKALSSLRTTLAVATCQMISELAESVHKAIDVVADTLISGLLKLASSTKKILVQSVEVALAAIICECSYTVKLVNTLAAAFDDKNVIARQLVARQIKLLLETHGTSNTLESSGGLTTITATIVKGLSDPSSVVRETFRASFWQLHAVYPAEMNTLFSRLDANTQTLVEKAKPNGELSKSTASVTNKSRPSVRAMIASKKASSASLRRTDQFSAETADTVNHKTPAGAPTSAMLKESSSGTPHSAATRRLSSFNPTTSGSSRTVDGKSGTDRVSAAAPTPRRSSKTGSPQSQTSSSPPTSVRQSAITPRLAYKTPPRMQSRHSNSSSGTLVLDDPVSTGKSTVAVSAIREQALHAEQTAERLLEIVDDHPKSKLMQSGAVQTPKASGLVGAANIFADSPEVRPARTSIADSWWLQRVSAEPPASPLVFDEGGLQVFDELLSSLQSRSITHYGIRQLSRVTNDKSVRKTPDNTAWWEESHRFSRLFAALTAFLSGSENRELAEVGLILLKDVIFCLAPFISGYETEIFSLLLKLRSENIQRISAASSALVELLIQISEPLYSLSCLRIALDREIKTGNSNEKQVAGSFALGLKALGTLFRKLPAEVVEEEVPLSRELLRKGINSASPETRHAAILAITAAHAVMGDERRLIDMIGGLTSSQAALLTYFINKEMG